MKIHTEKKTVYFFYSEYILNYYYFEIRFDKNNFIYILYRNYPSSIL